MKLQLHQTVTAVENWELRKDAIIKRLLNNKERPTACSLFAWGRMTVTIKDKDSGKTKELWKPRRADVIALFAYLFCNSKEIFQTLAPYEFVFEDPTGEYIVYKDIETSTSDFIGVQKELHKYWGVHKRNLCPAVRIISDVERPGLAHKSATTTFVTATIKASPLQSTNGQSQPQLQQQQQPFIETFYGNNSFRPHKFSFQSQTSEDEFKNSNQQLGNSQHEQQRTNVNYNNSPPYNSYSNYNSHEKYQYASSPPVTPADYQTYANSPSHENYQYVSSPPPFTSNDYHSYNNSSPNNDAYSSSNESSYYENIHQQERQYQQQYTAVSKYNYSDSENVSSAEECQDNYDGIDYYQPQYQQQHTNNSLSSLVQLAEVELTKIEDSKSRSCSPTAPVVVYDYASPPPSPQTMNISTTKYKSTKKHSSRQQSMPYRKESQKTVTTAPTTAWRPW